MEPHVKALLDCIVDAEAHWPELGTFRLFTRRRMPGFPGYSTAHFRVAEALYRRLNDNADPPRPDAGGTDWIADAELAGQTARAITDELLERGEVSVPGLGWFGVERRKLGEEEEAYFVAYRPDEEVLRALNPKDKSFEEAVKTEWPDGFPEGQPPAEA